MGGRKGSKYLLRRCQGSLWVPCNWWLGLAIWRCCWGNQCTLCKKGCKPPNRQCHPRTKGCLFASASRYCCGSKSSHWGTADCSPSFHLPGFHFGYLFLTPQPYISWFPLTANDSMSNRFPNTPLNRKDYRHRQLGLSSLSLETSQPKDTSQLQFQEERRAVQHVHHLNEAQHLHTPCPWWLIAPGGSLPLVAAPGGSLSWTPGCNSLASDSALKWHFRSRSTPQ